jgi:undecaprenyl-diphosphatase
VPAIVKTILESASFFGNNIPLALLTSLTILMYLVISGFLKESVFFIFANLSLLWSVVLKNIFKIPRLDTYIGDPQKLGDMFRFPSSHVIFYVCFWGFLFFLTLRKDVFGNGAAAHILRFLCLFHILLVGVSRIVVGAHTLQDVIAGYIFGGLYLALLIYLSR